MSTERVAEIETLMRDDASEYWKGSKAEGLQSEYRDLVTTGAGHAVAAPAAAGDLATVDDTPAGGDSVDRAAGATGAAADGLEMPADVANRAAGMWGELVRVTGVTAEQLEYAQPVFARYAPLFKSALRSGDRGEIARLGQGLEWELIAVGALTAEQLERARPTLMQRHPGFERELPLFLEEMRELNAMMADPASAYWKGPRAEQLQARWRDLYAGDATPRST